MTTLTSTRLPFDVYLDHVDREASRFREVLAPADPGRRVPSCPDWTVLDLANHLLSVHAFWTQVVGRRVRDAAQLQDLPETARRDDLATCLDDLHEQTGMLLQALRATAPETPAWTWSAEQTVGFTYRMQAHEAAMHRVDAELAAGVDVTPLDPALAADGIDKALRVLYGGCPPWATITPVEGRTMRLVAGDTGDTFLVSAARFTGTDPEGDGEPVDEPDIHTADADDGSSPAAATVSGTAAALDLWIWHRDMESVGEVEIAGDSTVVEQFRSVTAAGA